VCSKNIPLCVPSTGILFAERRGLVNCKFSMSVDDDDDDDDDAILCETRDT
jgi:hypothetical protein